MSEVPEDSFFDSFEMTGPCKVNIENVCKAWDAQWYVSLWKGPNGHEYTLCRHSMEAENFTKTNVKARIPEEDAMVLIEKLDLVDLQSPTFNSGVTYRSSRVGDLVKSKDTKLLVAEMLSEKIGKLLRKLNTGKFRLVDPKEAESIREEIKELSKQLTEALSDQKKEN